MLPAQLPDLTIPGLVSTYVLDDSDSQTVVSNNGTVPDGFVTATAAVWDSARRIPGAFALVLRQAERTAVAAAMMIVEGRAGLNLGLLMPVLRKLPTTDVTSPPRVRRFADRFHRTVWDIVERLSRTEADRVHTFRLGPNTVTVQSCKSGVTILSGCATMTEFVDLVRSAIDDGHRVFYSLTADPVETPADVFDTMTLFGPFDGARDDHDDSLMKFGLDGWPERLPPRVSLADTKALVDFAQKLGRPAFADAVLVSVLDKEAKTIISASRVETGVRMTSSAVQFANSGKLKK
jgi:hypothetical protein